MDFDFTDIGESGSPFFLFPISPNPALVETVEAEILSPSIGMDTTFKETDPVTDNHFINSLDFVYGLNDDFVDSSTSTSNSSSSTDDYRLVSIDEVSSSSDILETPSGFTPISETETSVTSKLKSVLMSRQKSRQKENTNTLPSIYSLHSYVSKQREQKHVDHVITTDGRRMNTDTTSSTLRFPPCCVCGGTASGLHYGVNTCEPCKGFFTRYLRKKEEYKCAKHDKCEITNRLRGNCSACRLKKCLALGMSRTNSRLGRYSLARRMETIKQVNKLDGKHVDEYCGVKKASGNVISFNDNSISKESEKSKKRSNHGPVTFKLKNANGYSFKLVRCLVDHMEKIKPYGEELVTIKQINEKLTRHYESFKLKHKLFGNMKTIPKEEYYTLKKEFGIEIDHRILYLKNSAQEVVDVISRYCNFGKQIPNFISLSNIDQSNLLKSSRYDFFMILMHESYHHEQQVFLAHNGVAFHREEVADKFFSRKLVLNVCDMYHRLQRLKLSKEEKALLIAISLLFTDRCVLENPELVERMQLSLTQLLQQQLTNTCRASATKRFTKIIDCLTIMRESSELYLREYTQLCNDERIIEDVPLMKEMLFDDI